MQSCIDFLTGIENFTVPLAAPESNVLDEVVLH
jgi:hypothetical protein